MKKKNLGINCVYELYEFANEKITNSATFKY